MHLLCTELEGCRGCTLISLQQAGQRVAVLLQVIATKSGHSDICWTPLRCASGRQFSAGLSRRGSGQWSAGPVRAAPGCSHQNGAATTAD